MVAWFLRYKACVAIRTTLLATLLHSLRYGKQTYWSAVGMLRQPTARWWVWSNLLHSVGYGKPTYCTVVGSYLAVTAS